MPSERKLRRKIQKYEEKLRKKRRGRSRTVKRSDSRSTLSPRLRRRRGGSSYSSRSPVRRRRSSSRSRSRSPLGHRRPSDDSRSPSLSPRRRQRKYSSSSRSRSRSPIGRHPSRSPSAKSFQRDNVNEDITSQSKREEGIPTEGQAEEVIVATTQAIDAPAPEIPIPVPAATGPEPGDQPPVNSDFHEALGEEYEEPTTFDGTIHEGITKRWSHILTNGLKKEERENITKKYKFPSNCTLLDAPLLNEEVKAVLTESSKLRDKGLEIGQKQVGLALSIVGTAMTKIMTEPEKFNKMDIISTLSEGTKLIADSLYHQTKTRIKLIAPALDKNFNQIIEKTKRDTHLFGSNLSEKIKNAKQLQQSVAHIKKPVPKSNTKTTGKNPQQNQGNKPGPLFNNKATMSGGPRANKPSFSRRPPAAPKQQRPERTYQAHRSAHPRR